MNKRDYKEFSEGSFVHIYNRGNNKEKIFYDKTDYTAFLFRLGLVLGFEESELNKHYLLSVPHSRIRITQPNKNSFKLHAFCLMPNHFHLLVEQCKDTSISSLISKLCTSYAKYINKKYDRVGHIFQDKFKAVNIENDPHFMWTSAYIHMNPVKSFLASHPDKYEWSSFKDCLGTRNLPILHSDLTKSLFEDTSNFEKETVRLADVKDGL